MGGGERYEPAYAHPGTGPAGARAALRVHHGGRAAVALLLAGPLVWFVKMDGALNAYRRSLGAAG